MEQLGPTPPQASRPLQPPWLEAPKSPVYIEILSLLFPAGLPQTCQRAKYESAKAILQALTHLGSVWVSSLPDCHLEESPFHQTFCMAGYKICFESTTNECNIL